MCYVHAYTQRYVHRNHATRPQKTTPDHTMQRERETCRQIGIPFVPLLIKPELGVGWIKLRMGPYSQL